MLSLGTLQVSGFRVPWLWELLLGFQLWGLHRLNFPAIEFLVGLPRFGVYGLSGFGLLACGLWFWCLFGFAVSEGPTPSKNTGSPLAALPLPISSIVVPVWDDLIRSKMGSCQNDGPFLGPYYDTAPII